MTKSDLYREWARVIDMCEGTNLYPDACWKFDGQIQTIVPRFEYDPNRYEFAIAILESRPVFVGDTVYIAGVSTKVEISSRIASYIKIGCISWEPPVEKPTFLLNGIEVPCPIKANDGYTLRLGATLHYFISSEDGQKARDVLNKILLENTK